MQGKKVTGKYLFCLNSPYYEVILKYVEDNRSEVGKQEKCDDLSTSKKFSNNLHAKDICQEFKFLYKSFSEKPIGKTNENGMLSDYDCDYLNYWLNSKLRENVNDGSINVKEFYEEIKSKDADFFSKHGELHNYLHIIDPYILKNMKLLLELYHTKQQILNIMLKEDYSINPEKLCPEYLQKCYSKYIEGMNKCLNRYDDFYKALKLFKMDYKYLIEEVTDKSGHCNISEHFRLPEYDPVLETAQRKITTIKIMSAPLLLSFVIPLLYKYTPLGPFLRTKINMIKNSWMNSDEYESELSSLPTDIEDNTSDNGEYNIGYYSGTN
ncbi:PIR Superfamily Protein [Plasmodium ovale curtisi]|uniref:PIR Superfamily Protein n=1 Tax=Plasmodium ovale curtisi TaxID=864141 RepID=A0A1A8WDK4_PLAOA|nr:PIR Superfamily Protein [Plasmodium ovale curtisi]